MLHFNTLWFGQTGNRSADDIFKLFFYDENVEFLCNFLLKFITKSPNYIKQALIQLLVQTDKKETSETMMA